jgi:hypothetical protein
MVKMADIQRQLERATGHGAAAAPLVPMPVSPLPPNEIPVARRSASFKAPSREGKIHIGAYLHPDFKKSLRLVQARTGKDIQALLADALNELFRVHNAPVIDQK